MNPIFTGLITPPESPVRYIEQKSSDGSTLQPPSLLTLDANPHISPVNEAQKAMEALSAAIQNIKAENVEQDTCISFSNMAPSAEAAPTSMALIDLSNAREIIYSIIENAVEEKMADAVGPLRLNVSRLNESLASFHRENTDIHDQNDTMSRQLDLHYRTIEQNVDEFRSQSKTMNTMIGAQADNLAATINMVSHLSQVVTNLPMAINQVVHTAVQQQTQSAIRDIMFAQQQAMFSISDVSGTRQSVSSDGGSSQCTCNHHGLEIESMSSTQNSSGSIGQASYNTSIKSNRGFRYSLRKLFRSSQNKTPSKKGRTAAHERRSSSKALKAEQTPKSEKFKTPTSTPRDTAYTHNLPTDDQKKGNGRVTGRSLIMWNRPRMAEKLILHLHYECVRHKVNIPWDAIAHRLRPGSSGAAVLQHVGRLRKELLAEGHLVPPPAQKASPSSPFDPSIRGYVRDTAADDKHATRAVGFDEKMDDAKINLPDALDALEEEDDGEDYTDANFAVPEDDIQLPVTPTPVRHAAPRRPMSAPHYNLKSQNFQRGNEEDTQLLMASNPLFDIAPPSFMLSRNEGLQPLGTKSFLPIEKQTQQMMSGGNLYDPFTGKLTHPPVKCGHGQVSPGGQAPLEHGQQPYLMGHPFYPHYAGYYGMNHSGFMALPPYGFSMPSSPPVPCQPAEKQNPLSSPIAIKGRDISSSPVSSLIDGQLQTLQPVAESPEEEHLDELTAAFAYDDEAFGHDLLLEFLASN
ncbi:hypothetical protein V8C37DRAFT_408910 [Trichoderma ceciliae]